ncbi:unnamed protein product, partial [Adineta ricciae]
NSLKLVREACQHWLNAKHSLAFVVQLGDLIDGFCASNNSTENDLRTILKEFEKLPRVYHLWGNHEFYNLTRNQLLASPLCSFDTKEISPSHYGTIEICPNLRIIALDTYDLSLLGIDENTERYDQAMSTLRKYNQNDNVNDRTGLDGYQQRFIQLNGGLTQKQLTWLRDQLLHARNHHDKVLIFGHIPVHPIAADEIALLWNYENVLDLLWEFDDVVLAYLAGHCHEGGYYYDEKRIHHITLQAIVECEPDINAFATVHVYNQHLVIEGIGRINTYRIELLKN